MRITEDIFQKAEKEGSAREFLFSLLKLLKGKDFSRKEFKSLNHEKVILEIVKENNLEPFFSISGSKNIYNALRKALREKFRRETEREWKSSLKNWRYEFERVLTFSISCYFIESGSFEKIRLLVLEDWIVPSYAVKEYSPGKEPFSVFKQFLDREFLFSRVKQFSSFSFLSHRGKILEDIVKSYFYGMAELSIYALFVQIEGVLWDIFVKGNPFESDIEELIRKRNRKFITVQYALKLIIEKLSGNSGKVPSVFDWVKFVDFKDDGTLNRNAVLHGISVNFGTDENFLKLFFLLDFLVSLGSYIHER
ncbi:hypothetical protein [Desulfurobacterium atlanticum]|uniref:DUF4209 domain-containing protein n=1 Tax=Desulfurobacterium atlanticum TaxID=240169 RepID=A0A238YFR3_9BACT|nr:hypothetical protein [Desulfurobacterium atlanticum]SNR69444.1 hypothetical protein SAMN06265340_10385 [Desulfurobacterium atlanticum]